MALARLEFEPDPRREGVGLVEEYFVSGGMREFRCLGGECEDTCCAGWVVPLERDKHRHLLVLAADLPEMRATLETFVHFEPGSESGSFVFDSNDRCGMLTADGLCSIHAKLGPEPLFDVCVTYPRYVSSFGKRREHFGALSCPEVTRRSLFSDDGLELFPGNPGAPRLLKNELDERDPYHAPFLLVRESLGRILVSEGFDLPTRFFFALYASEKLSEVYRRGSAPLPHELLAEFLGTFEKDAVKRALAENFGELPSDAHSALNLGTQVIYSRRESRVKKTKMRALVRELEEFFSFGEAKPLPFEDGTLESLKVRFENGPLSVAEERIVATTLERYALHALHVVPFVLSASPFVFLLELALRTASLRLFLRSLILARNPKDESELGALLVVGVYSFSREHEHTDVFPRLVAALEKNSRATLAVSVGLAKSLAL